MERKSESVESIITAMSSLESPVKSSKLDGEKVSKRYKYVIAALFRN